MCPLVLAKGWTVSLLYITSRLHFLLSRHCCYFCLRSQTLQLVTPGQHVNSASRWGLFRCLSTNFWPKIYQKGNAGNICSHCLPDCQLTTYSAQQSSVQFRSECPQILSDSLTEHSDPFVMQQTSFHNISGDGIQEMFQEV